MRRSLKGQGGGRDHEPDGVGDQIQGIDDDISNDIEEDLRFDPPETQRGLVDRKREDIGFQ